MNLLVVGETATGSLLRSLVPGLRARCSPSILDLWGPGVRERQGVLGRLARQRDRRVAGARVVEAVQQLRPSMVLLVKGPGVTASSIRVIQALGVPVACYYPDNPWWTGGQDPDALERLLACDLAISFAQRQAERLADLGARAAVVPFGYDPRWFPLTPPEADRSDVVFLGTWSPRRQRYLAALTDLDVPLRVSGTGWHRQDEVPAGPPITEQGAGQVLARAIVGVNLLHPQCTGAHNMRTREITATGALELTDPGTDGTPLVDRISCRVFASPEQLRQLVIEALTDRAGAVAIATEGQRITAADTYDARAGQLVDLLEGLR